MYITLVFPRNKLFVLKHLWLANQLKKKGFTPLKFKLDNPPRMIFENVIIPILSEGFYNLLKQSEPVNYWITKLDPDRKKSSLERAQETLEEFKRIKLPRLE